jgi:hypothetical protein
MQQDDRLFFWVGAGVIAAVAGAAILMWLASGINVEAPRRATVNVPPLQAPTPMVSERSTSQIVEASYRADDVDGPVRSAVHRLSSHPGFAAFLVNDRLLRRFVLAVDAVAGGYSPRDHVDFLRPTRDFVVREDGGRLVIAAGSYRRFNLVSEVMASFDTETAVDLYGRFSPQMEEIYREVAWASEDFDSRLQQAIDHLLEVSVPGGPIEVEQRAIVYAFADDEYESLSEAQKLLLRMGPANAGRVQGKLRELREAMGWSATEPPLVTAELEDAPVGDLDAPTIVAATEVSTPDDSIAERTGLAAAP